MAHLVKNLSAMQELACKEREPGSVPGLGRYPGEGNGYPLQYSGLENSMDCIVHGVTKSQTQLSNLYFEKRFNGDLWTKPRAGGSNDLGTSNEQYFPFQDL